VAAVLKKDLEADADLVEGHRGEFTVWVGEQRVAGKDAMGFPADQDVLAAVRKALKRG
jgi:hypothetical protein